MRIADDFHETEKDNKKFKSSEKHTESFRPEYKMRRRDGCYADRKPHRSDGGREFEQRFSESVTVCRKNTRTDYEGDKIEEEII